MQWRASLSGQYESSHDDRDHSTPTLAVAPYVVRVTNTDEMTYGEFSLFVVTQPSAKLNPWTTATAPLNTGRRGHAGVAGRVDNASRFLYAIGGDTGNGGIVLDSVEAIPVDIFGSLGTQFVGQNHLKAARTGLAAVERGGYIYVVGGSSDGMMPLRSVERAKILTDDDVPQVNDPTTAATEVTTTTFVNDGALMVDTARTPLLRGSTSRLPFAAAASGILRRVWARFLVPPRQRRRASRQTTAHMHGISSRRR